MAKDNKEEKALDLESLAEDARRLQQDQQSLLLATVTATGQPESSYAPYFRDAQGDFYIFVSELATHTGNLIAHPQCSILFIRNEAETRNIFARERLSFECIAVDTPRENKLYGEVLDQMTEQFGEMIKLLRGLPDFHLIKLKPESGRYVVGFGKAYDVDPRTGALSHIDPRNG
ncbi:MAG: pyridoxamine 5'-phosphate oxidase family protein [Motiliproteus sp.]|nr:pyridoxamine 5'-phosphate oxidase family protein [Motiliproteus sp.]